MSSEHIVIVARNTETGELRLPLGDMTLYGGSTEEKARHLLDTCRMSFSDEWALSYYRPDGDILVGTKSDPKEDSPRIGRP